MKLKSLALIHFLMLTHASTFSQTITAEAILYQALEQHRQLDGFSCQLSFTLGGDDPNNLFAQEGTFDFQRLPKDTVYGGRFKLMTDDYAFVYDSSFLYEINHRRKRVDLVRKSHIWDNGTPMISLALPDEHFTGEIKPFIREHEFTLTIAEDRPEQWVIDLAFTELDQEQDLEEFNQYFTIDKKTRFIVRNQRRIKSNGNVQTQTWNLENVTINPSNANDVFRSIDLPLNYRINYFPRTVAAAPDKASYYIDAGIPMIPFAFPDMNGDTIALEDLKDQVLLLDFWEYSCGGCLAAIPKLQRLDEKYRDKGLLVMGIFSERPKIIERIIQKRGISYPNLQCDQAFIKTCKIKAWPTVFLVKNGEIVFSGSGNDPKLEEIILANL